MNPIAYVLIGLNFAIGAINLAEKIITNDSVIKVLDTVKGAMTLAQGILGGVHSTLAEKVANGDTEAAHDPKLADIDAGQFAPPEECPAA